MADIEVSFASNAAVVAAEIDGAEKATGRAANTAERFSSSQQRVSESTERAGNSFHSMRPKLHAAALAIGLLGITSESSAGKIAGFAITGAHVGGPWGAAIGAAIGVVDVAMKSLGDNSEEAKKHLEELKTQLDKVAASRIQLTEQAAGEGNALNSKHGAEIRSNIYETGSILGAGKSDREKSLINMGMDPEAAKAKAESEQRYKDNGGLLGGREQNGAISPYSNPYQYGVIKNLNDVSEAQQRKEDDDKLKLGTGEYGQAIIDNEKHSKDVLELLKKVTTQEGRLKVEVNQAQKAVSPRPNGWHWSWSDSYWNQ